MLRSLGISIAIAACAACDCSCHDDVNPGHPAYACDADGSNNLDCAVPPAGCMHAGEGGSFCYSSPSGGCGEVQAVGSCCGPDISVCSESWCTSPDEWGGHDCWAGSDAERCTCSQGEARLTLGETHYRGQTYYPYTCCHGGDNVGEECGDCCNNVGAIVGIVVGSGFALCCFCAGVAGLGICWHQHQRRRTANAHAYAASASSATSTAATAVPMQSFTQPLTVAHGVPVVAQPVVATATAMPTAHPGGLPVAQATVVQAHPVGVAHCQSV